MPPSINFHILAAGYLLSKMWFNFSLKSNPHVQLPLNIAAKYYCDYNPASYFRSLKKRPRGVCEISFVTKNEISFVTKNQISFVTKNQALGHLGSKVA